ncbi:CDP-diacylglycerol--glycerol-3-phosphate 3-phosphatidyltransferase [Acetohalobium arabaticum]|uniref:CDP-diacylglycerol--glycerol-3-phosphate 3-phosphatidyltransferase n=1 Tax=Acetohalobium arabaticum (strain ATCC 49924 / DSM 5501 / Z-7288) TaxID=574087 RepID=D9QR88_ACEAZ|nr:CDP-diacylglycerol--glycerol-3-phosphate 3-phosphatidyltransferase [Acetohalobium arabaticum]ADL13029.1 CDP-diacylglycerol--glycerol-3-phosphate 3-phosphatidyltransferase [Acetohalobium arabaticum DSM 5501]
MNLPNKLTLLRIILVPIFMFFLLFNSAGESAVYTRYLAVAVFSLAAVTDGLDGYIARKENLVTRFGKFIDPLADKLLISAALVALVDMGEISAWAAIIIIGREFAITGLRVVAAADGIVISASKLGKYKTTLQIIAIIAIIINLPYSLVLLWLAVLLTVISGLDYLWKGRKVIMPNVKGNNDAEEKNN